jgi:hypothetical protein
MSLLTTNNPIVSLNVQVNVMNDEENFPAVSVEEEQEEGLEQDRTKNEDEELEPPTKQKKITLRAIKKAVTKVATNLHSANGEARQSGSKVANGTLAKLIKQMETEYNIPHRTIPPKRILIQITWMEYDKMH